MSKKKRIVIFLIVFAFVSGFVAFALINAKNAKEKLGGAPKDAVPVEVAKSTTEKIVTKVNAKGKVELIDKTDIYPEATGKIKEVHVKISDNVKKGQLLITFDESSIKLLRNQLADAYLALKSAQLGLSQAKLPPGESEVISSDSSIEQAKKSVKDAGNAIVQQELIVSQIETTLSTKKDTHTKTKLLFEQGIVSKADLELAEEAVRQAENQLETAKKQLDTAKTALDSANTSLEFANRQKSVVVNKTTEALSKNRVAQQHVAVEQASLKIKQIQKEISDFKIQQFAEQDGTILAVTAQNGDTVAPGKSMLQISDLSTKNIVLRIFVPENKISAIKLGQDVEIKGTALGSEIILGSVTKIFPQAEVKLIGTTNETIVTVEVSPKAETNLIKPGYNLEADVITRTSENAIVVPIMAVSTDDLGNDFVLTLGADFKVTKKLVKTGSFSGVSVEVEGISVGETVILNPRATMKDGSFARPIDRPTPSAPSKN